MKTLVTAAALLIAGAAHAQTPATQTPATPTPATPVPAPRPAQVPPAGALTRDLNSGPPAPAVYLAPAPAPAPASSAPAAAVAVPAPPTVASTAPPSQPSVPPAVAAPSRATPSPAAPATLPRTAPVTPPVAASPVTAAPVTAPDSVAATPPPAPAAPAVTVLDAAARAALPFTADLPPGFEIVTGRPGPDFRIYTVRRRDQSFVMVYAGPASQFPIYSGQMVEAGGRASILSTEGGVRHAVEHLFQRTAAPNEIHVWTMSLDGADRAMAEQIAQSVDPR